MMGRTHALSGLALFTAGTYPLHLPADQIAIGAVVCAGAAVLPDIDHHGSNIARTFGPITRGFAWTIGKMSGGHRNGTHSALGVGLVAALVFLSSSVYTRDLITLQIGCGITAAMLVVGVLIGLLPTKGKGRRAYKERWHGFVSIIVCAMAATAIAVSCYRYGHQAGAFLVGGILVLVLAAAIRPLAIKGIWDDLAPIPIAFVALWYHVDLSVMPYAIVIGVVIHIVGDMITLGGCPIGWPWSQTMFGPKWFKTGSRIERRIVAPILVAVLGLGVVVHVYPELSDRARTFRASSLQR
ncbi:metal-dependent hydrolase [Actinocorallia longicatena]|uniref:Metal-dependent hydrolase n=1 Tax=Actinocorallia longicatena TaxID=111803 RepID=A0ABP6PZE7_9ACTN